MTDLLKNVDPWFLNLCVFVFAGYFLWSVKGLFKDLKQSIKDLQDLIKDLYEHRNDHEIRIVALETKCTLQHGKGGAAAPAERQNHGRRATDLQGGI